MYYGKAAGSVRDEYDIRKASEKKNVGDPIVNLLIKLSSRN